jgi:hypothetical protein
MPLVSKQTAIARVAGQKSRTKLAGQEIDACVTREGTGVISGGCDGVLIR